MNVREAVLLTQAGEERGFGYLYENTYKSKYYLALKYMKNEEAAKDVLQDAYIRAFQHLGELQNPEAFSGWLGMIVANTAKNALVNKNPVLFSDLAAGEEDEAFEYQMVDENPEHQPELAYTRKETQELVHSLMDTLSPEQRICLLMFHVEGASIREIAETLDCSENTVKSRLNYGRKNLKSKAEELQKKGYKLYSVAPLSLLLLLLGREQADMWADGATSAAGREIAGQVFSQLTSHAAEAGAAHAISWKAIALAVGVGIACGVGIYAVSQAAANRGTEPQEETRSEASVIPEESETMAADTVTPTVTPTATPKPTPEAPAVQEMSDADYPLLMEGALTREELQLVLAYGPEEIPAGGFSEQGCHLLLNSLCQGSMDGVSCIEFLGYSAGYQRQYSLEDVNRMFSSFSGYQYTEGTNSYNVTVAGTVLQFFPATLNCSARADIVQAIYTETVMEVYFQFEK